MGAQKRGIGSRLLCVYIRHPLPTARGRYRRRSPAHGGGTRAPERKRERKKERTKKRTKEEEDSENAQNRHDIE